MKEVAASDGSETIFESRIRIIYTCESVLVTVSRERAPRFCSGQENVARQPRTVRGGKIAEKKIPATLAVKSRGRRRRVPAFRTHVFVCPCACADRVAQPANRKQKSGCGVFFVSIGGATLSVKKTTRKENEEAVSRAVVVNGTGSTDGSRERD